MRRLAVLALFCACTGGVDYAHFDDALIDARCNYYVRCGVAAAVTECQAFYTRTALDTANTQSALDAGKLVYHADTAQACLDAYAGLSCDTTAQTPADLAICTDVLTGTLAEGDNCAFSKECDSNNCVKPTCTSACCTGTCGAAQTLPAIGQPCTAFCADDAYCGIDGMCHAPLGDGAACDTEPCAYGLYCAGRVGTMPGRCRPLPHLGQPCEGACAEAGATCYNAFCVELGLLDDACTANAQCSMFYNCTNSSCALLPTLGMPCTTTCYEAAYCDGTTCIAQKANGSTCVRGDECDSHFCDNSKCADPPVCF